MARDIPSAPKVFTHTYSDFKGVDFTNDSTNVWHRRSPSAVNMLPDASGIPYKRTGWEVLLSNEDICNALAVDECSIQKCAWFELAGKDHIVIFTDMGVIFYADSDDDELNGEVTATTTEVDCYSSYDRCFFFEGNGMSAFYIYGNFRVWRYSYDDGFVLEEVTDSLTIPTVIIAASADGTGTLYNGYNLLGNLARVEYNDYDLFAYWGTDGLIFTVNKEDFNTAHPKNYSQKYTYDGSVWKDEGGTTVNMSTLGIVPTAPKENDAIFVVNANGVLLPNNVDIANQKDNVRVWVTTATQFDTEYDGITAGTPSAGQFKIHADTVSREHKQTWLEFNSSFSPGGLDGEDYIRAQFPSTEVGTQQITVLLDATTLVDGTATLDCEVAP